MAAGALAFSWITASTAIEVCLLTASACFVVLLIRFGLRRRHESKLSQLVSHQIEQSNAFKASLQDQKLLKDHLRHTIKLLHTSRTAGGQGPNALSDLPWYLVIGAKGAGKTSLLTDSGLSVALTGAAHDVDQAAREHCDWYLSPQAVFIETASRYLDDTQSGEVFVNFLKLLRKQRKPIAVNAILLTVSLEQLVTATSAERNALASRLSIRISDYALALGVIPPIHLVLTKADQLPGFMDVFGDMSAESSRQPWGVFMGEDASGEDRYEQKIKALLNKLHVYVHQRSLSGSAPASVATLQFANYLMGLSGALEAFLLQLESAGPFANVRSLHFTSVRQGPESLPAVFQDKVVEGYGLKLRSSSSSAADQTAGQKSFFVTDLFRQIIFPDRYAVLIQPSLGGSSRLSKLVKSGLLTMAVGVLVLKGFYFASDQEALRALSRALSRSSDTSSASPLPAWQALVELRKHLSSLETPSNELASLRGRIEMDALQAVRQ